MNILIAGDFCLQDRLETATDNNFVSSPLLDIIQGADYSIANLEAPILGKEEGKKRLKQGPSLKCGENAINVLKSIGFNCVTLANNHIMDYGYEALVNTFNVLSSNNIEFLGAGVSLQGASSIKYKTIDGLNIAFVNCCEHEFSIADKDCAGANPLNPISLYYQIKDARKEADYIVLIVHGGIEHFQYPTKRMVQTYRFFVDAGADVVINHHQHCPCGYEFYNGKPIYYGLGNFCFDWKGRLNSLWNLGYLVRLSFFKGDVVQSELIPYRQCNESPIIELLNREELNSFNQSMVELCEAITDDSSLDARLVDYNKRNDYLYRKMLEPYSGKLANGLYSRGVLPSTLSKDRIIALKDFIMCESHYERVKEFIDRQYNHYIHE